MESLKDIVYYENLPGDEIRWMIKPTNVADFFKKSDSILRIPPYQRPYSWGESQMRTMFDDLQKNINKESIPWFLGPIFTTKKEGYNRYIEILDGQQRITSITIILREALCLFKSFDPPLQLSENQSDQIETLNRKISRCLVTDIKGEDRALFETDESVRDDFANYIMSVLKIKNLNDYKKYKFINRLGNSEFEQTYKNITANIQITRDHLVKMIEVEPNNPIFSEQGFDRFCSFIDYLLRRCWFIEIPLKDEDYILEIFESINNRGKRLTLSDIIRFKTIHYSDKNSREDLKKRWSEVYKLIDKIESGRYIQGSDHFFEILINSMYSATDKKAFTKDEDRIEQVEKILNNPSFSKDENIESFMVQIERVLYFFNDYIITKDFITVYNGIQPKPSFKDIIKAEQLMKLVRLCIRTSKNSLLLAFYIARKFDIRKSENANSFLQPMLNMVKYTVLKDINLDESSNTMRTLFVELIYSIEKNECNLMNFYYKQTDTISSKGVSLNLLLNENPSYNKLVLLFTQFLANYEELKSIDSNVLIESNNLEHFYPISWKDNWLKIDKTQIIDSLEEISNSHLKSNLLADIDSLCLKGDGKERGTVLQFLGNKIIIHGSDNKSIGKNSFDKKVEKLSKPNIYIIPILPGSDFLKQSDFGVNDIIKRNELITQILMQKSDLDYASF